MKKNTPKPPPAQRPAATTARKDSQIETKAKVAKPPVPRKPRVRKPRRPLLMFALVLIAAALVAVASAVLAKSFGQSFMTIFWSIIFGCIALWYVFIEQGSFPVARFFDAMFEVLERLFGTKGRSPPKKPPP